MSPTDELENAGLRNELEPFWAWKWGSPELPGRVWLALWPAANPGHCRTLCVRAEPAVGGGERVEIKEFLKMMVSETAKKNVKWWFSGPDFWLFVKIICSGTEILGLKFGGGGGGGGSRAAHAQYAYIWKYPPPPPRAFKHSSGQGANGQLTIRDTCWIVYNSRCPITHIPLPASKHFCDAELSTESIPPTIPPSDVTLTCEGSYMFVDIPKDMLTGDMQGADVRLQNADPLDTDCWGQEATGPAGELVIRVSTNLTGCNTNSSVITTTSSMSMSKSFFFALFVYIIVCFIDLNTITRHHHSLYHPIVSHYLSLNY